jgi:hypothetical protein
MNRALLSMIVFGLACSACPGDVDVENRTFPCRAAGDCVEGFECHPTRYVCVVAGSVGDAGLIVQNIIDGGVDAGTMRSGLGGACNRSEDCSEGTCADGVCCSTACDGECRRCDMIPGTCTLVQDGEDPDSECTTQQIECSSFTFGTEGSSCYANAAQVATRGVCGPSGVCRPVGCAARGAMISQCENLGCLSATACPRGAPVTAYDEPSELCTSGPAATCALMSGDSGCCSLLGACCANATCTPDQQACE